MDGARSIWLVNNAASGSNDGKALEELDQCLGSHGFRIAHRTVFPEQDLPTPAILDAAVIECLAVFAGDGTVNALIGTLAGWSGAVLVLAGGTMNLLYHRLHGERSLDEVIAALADGDARRHRPGIIRSRHGDALAGVLAGPGASWGSVREAMRDQAALEMAGTAINAIQETLTGKQIACLEPKVGNDEGYPLINLTPTDVGIEIDAYAATTAKDYLDQAWALAKRDFRQGPHDRLGTPTRVRLASTGGSAFGLLIDGEQSECGAEEEFTLVRSEVDLLATA
ncbi:MAG: diacylglycerol kinase family protein [Croceibacterium sp.]